MKIFIYGSVSFLLISCANQIEKKDPVTSSDTLAVTNKTIEASFDDKLFNTLQLPLNIDTTYVMKIDTNDRIPYQQVRALGSNFLKNEQTNGLEYEINKFCEIDSLKQEDKYKEYIEKLDLGMTKKSIAFKIGLLSFSNGSKLFLWGIESSSYEACPFFSARTVIGTFVNDNKQNTHFIIAGRSGAGDPPSMMNEDISAKINADGRIEIESVMVNDDLDIAGQETKKESVILKAEKNKIQIADSKKETTNTEKSN